MLLVEEVSFTWRWRSLWKDKSEYGNNLWTCFDLANGYARRWIYTNEKHCPNTNYSLCRMLIICNTLLSFKRHSRNAFGVHEGFIVYTCNQTATSVVNQRKVARMHMYWKKNTLVGSYKKIIIVRSWYFYLLLQTEYFCFEV